MYAKCKRDLFEYSYLFLTLANCSELERDRTLLLSANDWSFFSADLNRFRYLLLNFTHHAFPTSTLCEGDRHMTNDVCERDGNIVKFYSNVLM